MKRGLVVEGGGMRGAHTCGALMALKDRGLDHFDVVTASSAGALTVAFFVARQFDLFPSVWVDYLHDGTFLNFKNIFKRRHHIMDIDYLVETVFGKLVPLDCEAVQGSASRFFITVTDCVTGRPIYLDAREVPLKEALKATAAMPFVYRRPIFIKGRRCIDGGISDSIPLQKALAEGCEEILVLSTRPAGYRKKPMRWTFWIDLLFPDYPKLRWTLKNRYYLYNKTAAFMENLEREGRLKIIQPARPLPLTRLSSGRDQLKRAVEIGYQDACRCLSVP